MANTVVTHGATSIAGTGYGGIVSTATIPLASPSWVGSNNLNIVSLYNYVGKKLLEVDNTGVVTWASDINIDEAAEAFSKSLNLGIEIKSGISKSVKERMRDSIFTDLIGIAKDKGNLTADDLTYLLQASKIIERLEGK